MTSTISQTSVWHDRPLHASRKPASCHGLNLCTLYCQRRRNVTRSAFQCYLPDAAGRVRSSPSLASPLLWVRPSQAHAQTSFETPLSPQRVYVFLSIYNIQYPRERIVHYTPRTQNVSFLAPKVALGGMLQIASVVVYIIFLFEGRKMSISRPV